MLYYELAKARANLSEEDNAWAFRFDNTLDTAEGFVIKLLQSLHQNDRHHRQAYLTASVIYLAELLSALNTTNFRVSDKGPLIQYIEVPKKKPPEWSGDLTTLIQNARNVCCHPESGLYRAGDNIHVGFNWIGPGQGNIVEIEVDGNRTDVGGEPDLTNRTKDDQMIVFGGLHIYLHNNIVFGLNRARDQFREWIKAAAVRHQD